LKSGKWILAGTALLAAALLHAEMQQWVQHLPSGDWLKVFFASVTLPDGPVEVRRPPVETRPALTQLIAANPNEAALFRLRAQEDELQLDFVAAESDWRRYVQSARDPGAAWLELADFYNRRHQSAAEIEALRIAGHMTSDRFAPLSSQRSWLAFQRALRLIADQALPDSSAVVIYQAWIARYPQEAELRQQFVEYLIAHHRKAAAGEEIAAYKKAFPSDAVFPLKATADLAADPLVVYEGQFQPLWPDELTTRYFKLLEDSSGLRTMVGKARAQLTQNPEDIRDAGRLFLYWRQQNNLVAARRVLEEYKLSKQSRKTAWNPDELYTLARLFEKLPDVAEAAELYYVLYSLPGADAYYAEQALGALANLLLSNSEQPIRYGSGDLSFYKDIATIDRAPGFLNGILSLILNGTGPRWEYERQNTASAAYFHRAAASDLVDLLDRRYPHSARRAGLHAQLILASNIYGDDEAVIRGGRQFLTAFPRDPMRLEVALTVGDALARRKQESQEFALYDQVLGELALRADGVPLGANAGTARSPEYARVLDRYLARLMALQHPLDAIRLYRSEIQRNPNDPGLYERLAAFLDQNRMSAETEAIYKEAMAKFTDRGWYQKLARWYLRRQEHAEIGDLTHQLIDIFSGTELERYFADIVTTTNLGPILYRQMNLYALQRFPEDLVFVHNLLAAYSTIATRNDAAAMRLLRQYWFYDAGLRNRYFETLSRAGRLDAELAAVRAANPNVQANAAAAQFLAEGEAWRSHFEDAAAGMKVVADFFPGDRALVSRATSVYRSLATVDDKQTAMAVALARVELRSDPRDRETLAKIGDIYADHERLTAARPSWDAMPSTAPGKVDAWRDTATVFWDYYLFDDALRVIRTARSRLHNQALLAYEAGAIYEGKRQDDRAVAEYLNGYLAGDSQSERRILRLARQPALRGVVDHLTADVADKPDAKWNALSLRVAVLEQQQRSGEIGPLLLKKIAGTRSPELLHKIEEVAGNDLAEVRQRAIEREIAVTQDPVEQARQRIALVHFLESRKEPAAAASAMEALYRERPQILGVVRATVDYYTRNQQSEEAIRVLMASAGRANQTYRDQFTLEAAKLATSAHNFARARELLQPLLQRDPYRSDYLAAIADSYLQAGDDKSFRDFELTSIQSLRSSPLPPADRTARIAAVRRNLIPALTRLGDFPGAVDQYIDVINAYPEDETLIREASLYASRHSLGDRIAGFYHKTIADAPRDYRWPMVLARIETALEDFPAAISAYDAALKARPDRKDLLASRETLEERSMEFDRAIASCQTLYELSYHDPDWVLKSATLKARLGRREDAIHDLRAAEIGDRNETMQTLMTVAQQLDQWGYDREAADFAERARRIATPGFDAGLWARVMVRGRRFDEVLAQSGTLLEAAIQQAGQAVRDYYTPEEKASVEASVRKSVMTNKLEFAEAAEFTQFQSDLLESQLAQPDPNAERKLVTLQTSRARFAELGASLEAYAARNGGNPVVGNRPLIEAESAWRSAGDRSAELRVLGQLYQHGDLQNRYLTLLDRVHRDQILAIARTNNSAVAFAVHTGDFAFAQQALEARGTTLSPVWIHAYTALSGVYDGVHTAAVDTAFQASLGGGTIGERVRHRPDPKRQIIGSTWFYYGARYGKYLARAGEVNARDYLPATVEAAPGNPNAYFALGDYYEQNGEASRAIDEYQAVLELDANRGEAENAIARVLWHDNRHDDAITHWHAALAAFDRVENRGVRVPEGFWSGISATFGEIGRARQISALRPDIEKLLRGYVNINGEYRSQELMGAAVHACFESGANCDWALALSDDLAWWYEAGELHFTAEQQEEIARRSIAIAALHATEVVGESRGAAEFQVLDKQLKYIGLLLDHGKYKEAQQTWDALSREQRELPGTSRTIELKLAAVNGVLPQLLARYQAAPSTAPFVYELEQTADYLRKHDHVDAARAILEYFYQNALDKQEWLAANFLGLAGVYLEEGRFDLAVRLLRRMNLVAGEEFETFVPAATVLAEHGRTADAIPFLQDRLKAAPWDDEARLQLARLLPGDERRTVALQLIHDGGAVYRNRSAAARLVVDPMADAKTELGLLQRGTITTEEASKPFYVEARRVAGLFQGALATRPSDLEIRLETLRAALAGTQDSLAIALAPQMFRAEPYMYRQDPDTYREQAFLATSRLSHQEKAGIARDIAHAYEHEGDLATAIRYDRIAITLGLDLDARVKELEAERKRDQENAQRAPQIHDHLEQDHVVKPSLPRRTA
jgi:thioredoxin-like negative regulator of GroEL